MPAFSGASVSRSGSRRSAEFRVHLFTLPTPIGFDDDMVTKLGEKGETLRK